MKNLYAFILALACSALVAQPSYYVLPAIDFGENPGNLNNDGEYPVGGGLDASWTSIIGATTTDQWSGAQSIPFNFQFDGNSVSSYYVSNTGVVTFNSNPGTPPSTNNVSLPSLALPDMSVCAWGLELSGSNDYAVRKTFGTAPNRQHWIMFSSASGAGLPANGWTYWSIVLEETTNKIYVVDQRTGNGTVGLTVGIQVSATNYVEVSGSPSVANNAGTDPFADDNSYYEFVYGTMNNYDIAGVRPDISSVVKTNTSIYMSGLFRNVGSNQLLNADFNYQVNGGTVNTATAVGNLPISTGQIKDVSSQGQWTPTTAGQYEVKMWLSNLNGNSDQNNSNDTISFTLVVADNPPERKVVIEERTGTWCGWCPRGMVAMDIMNRDLYESTVLIAVHNQDPMAVAAYDNNLSGNFPSFSGDRTFSGLSIAADASNMKQFHNNRRELIPEASVEITSVDYNSTTGNLKVDVEAEFFADIPSANYRFELVLTEDGVQGTTSGYAQVNYYSNLTSQPDLIGVNGENYTQMADPIPASEIVYQHVAIDIQPQFGGAPGSVPSSLTFGQKVNYTFNTTVPSRMMNENHVKVNVLLLDHNKSGEVVNADKKKMTNVISLDENDQIQAAVYPNPAHNLAVVQLEDRGDYNLELINAVGQVVLRQQVSNSQEALLNVESLAEGVYMLRLSNQTHTSTLPLSIRH